MYIYIFHLAKGQWNNAAIFLTFVSLNFVALERYKMENECQSLTLHVTFDVPIRSRKYKHSF